MEIKRTTEILVITHRRFVIRRMNTSEQIICLQCDEPMLATEQIAALFGISQRTIFQFIETGSTHFSETETGAVMICPSSFAAILSDGKQLPAPATEEF